MAKLNDRTVVTLWREATRLAGVALASEPGLPDKEAVSRVAAALISAGLVSGKAGQSVDRAGQDADQNKMLADQFDGADGETY